MFKVNSISVVLFGESFTFYHKALCDVVENIAKLCNVSVYDVHTTHSDNFTGEFIVRGNTVGTYIANL